MFFVKVKSFSRKQLHSRASKGDEEILTLIGQQKYPEVAKVAVGGGAKENCVRYVPTL